jgi:hypothetical protein
VNLLGDKIDAVKQNTTFLIGASKEIGLEINVEETKCMLLSLHQSQNLIQEEIKRRLNSGNACLSFGPESSVFSSAVKKRKN